MSEQKMIICGASKGRYSKPIPITKIAIKWVNQQGKIIAKPKELGCDNADNPLHAEQKWFPYKKMYVQKWILIKKERAKAIKEFDMISLDMPVKIICPDCWRKIRDAKNKVYKA